MFPKETVKSIVLIITGPTASGKSAVALQIAQVLGGEIVSADSMQIYRGLDIGTAKATSSEQQLIPHHLIDICEPDEYYSVASWKKAAIIAIEDILTRGRLPIICGGTGQYISALVDGLTFAPVASDIELRERLNERAKNEGTAGMLREIAGFDPATASRLHENDHKRIIRAIEIHHLTGRTTSEMNEQSRLLAPIHQYISFCMWPDREWLYNRIDQRVDRMLSQGLINEVKHLVLQNLPDNASCRQAIGYKEVFRFLEGTGTLQEVSESIKLSTRHYAKRQFTWFRRMMQLVQVPAEDTDIASRFILQHPSISDTAYCLSATDPLT